MNALDAANCPQNTLLEGEGPTPVPSPAADPRALDLLIALQSAQQGLPRGAALAWERTAFAEVFLNEEPGRRVRHFLGEKSG